MILTLKTTKVAPHRRDGEGGRPGKEVKKGLLLNGIDIHGNGPSEDEAEELAFPVLPYSADPSLGR
jgi:hypothetical protein